MFISGCPSSHTNHSSARSSSFLVPVLSVGIFALEVTIPLLASHLKLEKEDAVLSRVAAVQRISSSGTMAEANRFHDDKGTYTGSHAVGGAQSRVFCASLSLFPPHLSLYIYETNSSILLLQRWR